MTAPPSAAASGDIFVLDNSAFGSGGIIRVDPPSGARTTVFQDPPFNAFTADTPGIDVAPDGSLVYSDLVDGALYRVDPETGTRTRLARSESFSGVAVEKDGRLVVVEKDRIVRINPVTGSKSLVTRNSDPRGGPPLFQPLGIDLEPDGDIIVADSLGFRHGGVIRVDPETGRRTTVSRTGRGDAKIDFPLGVAVEGDGDIVVLCEHASASVVRIKRASGRRTLVSRNSSPGGTPAFESVSGVAVEADGEILVSNAGSDDGAGVLGIDPRTGVRRAVSTNASPPGEPLFGYPVGLTVAP